MIFGHLKYIFTQIDILGCKRWNWWTTWTWWNSWWTSWQTKWTYLIHHVHNEDMVVELESIRCAPTGHDGTWWPKWTSRALDPQQHWLAPILSPICPDQHWLTLLAKLNMFNWALRGNILIQKPLVSTYQFKRTLISLTLNQWTLICPNWSVLALSSNITW